MRVLCVVVAVLVGLLPEVSAQVVNATVAGVVRDTSGAVLPGVTVEVASPALIEKVRSTTTDSSGQYRLPALPPGTYSVRFSLPGFSTINQEGVVLETGFTATISPELRVGAVEETITVTGETPIIDVESARQLRVVDGDALKELP